MSPLLAGELPVETVILESKGQKWVFHVEIADEEREREKGLMFRRSLAQDAGMLFLYPRPMAVAFWMENTYVPLDMLFIAKDGTILSVVSRAVPLSRTPIPSPGPVSAVLEINAGLAEKWHIGQGARLRNPQYFP